MKTNIATDKSQSQRLLACGVPADMADMYYFNDFLSVGQLIWDTPFPKKIFPAFSLSRLLELMPKEMGIAIGAYPGSDKYTCFTLIDPDIESIVADTTIEACVLMVEALTANGYKLNNLDALKRTAF